MIVELIGVLDATSRVPASSSIGLAALRLSIVSVSGVLPLSAE